MNYLNINANHALEFLKNIPKLRVELSDLAFRADELADQIAKRLAIKEEDRVNDKVRTILGSFHRPLYLNDTLAKESADDDISKFSTEEILNSEYMVVGNSEDVYNTESSEDISVVPDVLELMHNNVLRIVKFIDKYFSLESEKSTEDPVDEPFDFQISKYDQEGSLSYSLLDKSGLQINLEVVKDTEGNLESYKMSFEETDYGAQERVGGEKTEFEFSEPLNILTSSTSGPIDEFEPSDQLKKEDFLCHTLNPETPYIKALLDELKL